MSVLQIIHKLQTRLYPAIIHVCRMSDMGENPDEGGILVAGAFRRIGETYDDENVIVEKKLNVEHLDPYERTHTHELAIAESESVIKLHEKLLIDPNHKETINFNEDTIEQHKLAIKIHEVFLKKDQV